MSKLFKVPISGEMISLKNIIYVGTAQHENPNSTGYGSKIFIPITYECRFFGGLFKRYNKETNIKLFFKFEEVQQIGCIPDFGEVQRITITEVGIFNEKVLNVLNRLVGDKIMEAMEQYTLN